MFLDVVMDNSLTLSSDEQLELIKDYQQNNNFESRNLMLRSIYKILNKMAIQYSKKSKASTEVFFKEALIGACEGIDRFDVNSGNRPFTYLVWYIRKALSEYVQSEYNGVIVMTANDYRKSYKHFKETGTNLCSYYYSKTITPEGEVKDIFDDIASDTEDSEREETLSNCFELLKKELSKYDPKHEKIIWGYYNGYFEITDAITRYKVNGKYMYQIRRKVLNDMKRQLT